MKMKWVCYLRVDMRRAFGSWKIMVGIFGIFLSFLYGGTEESDALCWISSLAGTAVLVMAALMFAIFPYGAVFCEDMEYHYDRQMILRGGVVSYTLSKIVTVFLSAVFTMFCGIVLALLFFLAKYGLPDAGAIEQAQNNCFSPYISLLLTEHFILFGFCTCMHLAVLAGTLAVIGLMCSLFVKNRMLVYILPVAFLYVEDIVIQRMLGWEVGSLFSLNGIGVTALGNGLETHTWQLYYFEIFLSLVLLGAVICLKYRKKVA